MYWKKWKSSTSDNYGTQNKPFVTKNQPLPKLVMKITGVTPDEKIMKTSGFNYCHDSFPSSLSQCSSRPVFQSYSPSACHCHFQIPLLTPHFATIIFPQEHFFFKVFFTLGKWVCQMIWFHCTLCKFIYLVASRFHAELGKNVLFS